MNSIRGISRVDLICEFVDGDNIDCAILAKTWLHDDPTAAQRLGELTRTDYIFNHKGHLGGGVGVLLKQTFKVKMFKVSNFTSFECLDLDNSLGKAQTCLIAIYFPPSLPRTKPPLHCSMMSSPLAGSPCPCHH